MKTLRILHVSPQIPAKYLEYLCRSLQIGSKSLDIKVEVSVLSCSEKSHEDIGQLHEVPHKILPRDAAKPWTIPADELIINLKQFDVIHVHHCLSYFGLYVAAHARLLGKCTIGTNYEGEDHFLSYCAEVSSLFDFLHTFSTFGANTYKNLKRPIKVIRGLVDTEIYRPNLKKFRNPNLVLALGDMLPRYGFEKIIDALPPELELTIVSSSSDQEYRNYLQSRIQDKKVNILENLTDNEISILMQTAGVFVHAATYKDYLGNLHPKPELLGLASLEALSSGLITFVSDVGALPELANHLPGCYVFHSTQELAALFRIFLDKKLSVPDCDWMHQCVNENYGLKKFGCEMLAVIQEYLQ